MTPLTEASAPAKIILLGEHAVVYGQPAIAVPVSSLRATVSAHATPGTGLRIVAADSWEALPRDIDRQIVDEALSTLVRLVLDHLNAPPPDLTLELRSDIAIASGLGSGAAVSAALARALSSALGQPLDLAALNALVYETEKLHHGNPSGIDNTVVVYEEPVYFIRDKALDRLAIPTPLHLLIGDTGQSASTRATISAVRALYDSYPAQTGELIAEIGLLVNAGRHAIEVGDTEQLGRLMTRNHAFLQQLTVSSSVLDGLVEAALAAGALGAKLSGGGRGGNMIALVTPDSQAQVRAALIAAGAARVTATSVGTQFTS